MRKEAARTHIFGETQGKIYKLLRHERPRWRMESVTPRGLDVNCHFRLDKRDNLAVDKRQDLSSKPAAPRSRNATTQSLQPVNTHAHIT